MVSKGVNHQDASVIWHLCFSNSVRIRKILSSSRSPVASAINSIPHSLHQVVKRAPNSRFGNLKCRFDAFGRDGVQSPCSDWPFSFILQVSKSTDLPHTAHTSGEMSGGICAA